MKNHDQGDATIVTGRSRQRDAGVRTWGRPGYTRPRNLLSLEGSLTGQGGRMLLMSTIRRI